MRRRAAVLLLLAGGLAFSPPARAGQAPPIAVVVPDCPAPPLSIDAFLETLRAELAGDGRACCTRLTAPPAAEPQDPIGLAVDPCGPEPDVVRVRARDRRTGAALERQVALGDVSPEARPRALALAVAELVRAAAAPPAPPPSPPPPAARAAAIPAPPRDGWSPLFGIAARTLPTGDLTLLGFHAGLELARGRAQAVVEAHVESANPPVPLGSVDTTFAGGSLELGARFRPGKIVLDAGAVGTLGVARMNGVSRAPGAVTASGSGLAASGGARAAIDFWSIPKARARVRLVLEAGAVVRGFEATVNGRHAAGLTGPYLMAGLGVAMGPY
jgi:hypothetical protein